MAEFTQFKGYPKDYAPSVPRPDVPPEPVVLTVQEGVPVVYPGCHGVGVRVVHPVNPAAPAKNLGLVMFYLPPHVINQPGSHETEETYVILEGKGENDLRRQPPPTHRKGHFHLFAAMDRTWH